MAQKIYIQSVIYFCNSILKMPSHTQQEFEKINAFGSMLQYDSHD